MRTIFSPLLFTRRRDNLREREPPGRPGTASTQALQKNANWPKYNVLRRRRPSARLYTLVTLHILPVLVFFSPGEASVPHPPRPCTPTSCGPQLAVSPALRCCPPSGGSRPGAVPVPVPVPVPVQRPGCQEQRASHAQAAQRPAWRAGAPASAGSAARGCASPPVRSKTQRVSEQ